MNVINTYNQWYLFHFQIKINTLMLQKTFLLTIILLFCSTVVWAQASGNATRGAKGNMQYNTNEIAYNQVSSYNTARNQEAQFINDSTIVIEVNTLLNQKADEYVAILNLTQLGKTIKEANDALESRIQNFIAAIISAGVPRESIYIDFISQIPLYSYEIDKKIFSKTANEVPFGFELQKNLHISYKNSTDLDKIMLLAADYEIYDLVKVDYIVKDMEAVYDLLRTKTTDILKKKVEMLKMLNININPEILKYNSITEDIRTAYPAESYESYTAYSSTTLNRDIKTESTIRKPETFYYNKIHYGNFDAVINPILLEPSVQFVYSIKVKYSLKKK
ncbi:MAG: hypothetical protein EAZ55_08200 [Cytophagales bacterium]|nr:MAG: hypothetical protein EAZ55_08200 [Cytophagales bacterium]